MSWKLRDLYCGAGGAARGYELAGFTDIVGVDVEQQPNYPYQFVCGDAIGYLLAHGHKFDAIHASPPCQFASHLTEKKYRKRHSNWIPATRAALRVIGKPWIIENVAGARNYLEAPIMLCGSMFGLDVWRHRFFECEPRIAPPIVPCDHSGVPVVVSGSPRRNGDRTEPSTERRREALETPWMRRIEMDDAIPPRYTKFLGEQLIAILNKEAGTTTHNTCRLPLETDNRA
jgi:DNA (cytosine-5)-methyltransferase 1